MKIKWIRHNMAGKDTIVHYDLTNGQVPDPGSNEAIEAGCTCPVFDNAHGAGIPWPREDGKDPNKCPSFWVNEECKLHGSALNE